MNNTVIDLFAGAGGFGLGFQNSGYELLYSVEIDKWACDTLKHNCQHEILKYDVAEYNSSNAISKIIKNKPNIIIGGPPCQGFSIAGKKEKNDQRNKLYLTFLKWVEVLNPQIFVIENVPGILTYKNNDGKKVFDDIKEKCRNKGYRVSVWDLNSMCYGVPQNRHRIFIIGYKGNEIIEPPKETHGYTSNLIQPVTVGDAILDLPLINAREGQEEMEYTLPSSNSYQYYCRANSNKVYNHVAMNHTERIVKRYEYIIKGMPMKNIKDEFKVRKRNGNGKLSNVKYNSNYRHLKAEFPSFTIPAHFYSSFIHPNLPRNITTREAARLQSFPDKYKFKGKRTMMSKKLLNKLGEESYLSQYNQVGNAVPPLLANKIADHLKKYL